MKRKTKCMRLKGNPLLKTLRRPAENKKTGKFRR